MLLDKYPVNKHLQYHAHVYFDQESLSFATDLCNKAGTLFSLPVGRFHQKPIGPHPVWSCQITFTNKNFEAFIPWLDQQRHGLTVLVHGLTGDNLKDHTEHAYWLGDEVALDLTIFRS